MTYNNNYSRNRVPVKGLAPKFFGKGEIDLETPKKRAPTPREFATCRGEVN